MNSATATEPTYGGFWIRVLSHVIDTTLLLCIVLPINVWVYGFGYFESTTLIAGPVDFLVSWVAPAVAVILFWKYREATPGKMLLGLRVVDAETLTHPSTGQYTVRYSAYLVALLPLGFGFLWVAWDPRKQGWHDKLAKTVVLRRAR